MISKINIKGKKKTIKGVTIYEKYENNGNKSMHPSNKGTRKLKTTPNESE
jgi:hypothetical protein